MKLNRALILSVGIFSLIGCSCTPPANLGIHNGKLRACPSSPNCVSSQDNAPEHRITPLQFTGDPTVAFHNLKQTLKGRKDTTIIESSPEYMRVELRTPLFVDDGEFLLDRDHNAIHIRSASRIGYSDLGKNRSRMEEIRLQFEKNIKN